MSVTQEQNQVARELGPRAAQLEYSDLVVWAQEMYQELKNIGHRCQMYRRELLASDQLANPAARYFTALEKIALETIDPGFTD